MARNKTAKSKKLSIKADTKDTRDKLTTLERKVSEIDAKSTKNESEISQVSDDLNDIQSHVLAFDSKLARQSTINRRMQRKITDLKAHSMKNNIIFSFDNQVDFGRKISGEDFEGLIRHFIVTILRIPGAEYFYIPVAHRLGRFVKGKRRSVLAKFPIASESDLVMKHANRLTNTKHYVQKQIPPELRERRQFAMPTYLAKKSDPANRAHMKNEKLFVKGSLQAQFLKPILPDPDDTQSYVTESDETIIDSGRNAQLQAYFLFTVYFENY